MKKSDLVAVVAQKTGLSKKDVSAVIDASIEAIEEALKKGDKVSFIGFGSFEVVKRAPRVARVPGTNKEVKIPASKSVKFKVGKKLKETVNS
ncbi:HU family DNA-binding protein [Caminibacter pacificus]|jgi:DNA-binding protein HU-beta|uniref:DNA-binding protein HU-beta n=1 Tax=Caminibacter pacificus TaxID=1424653 RepID=A0AAJ4REE3_9BACT|nr:HU family DNA-binding protein [Caminibacter pacificus]NPA87291.1 HU family DNA-binding protein [Campylobacterota bacterium]QCI28085.1 HU family DNA-binding protein [Caminibacter pacificus]ROR41207.1 DNA-binding protein HU-beta [Caminibacter pacificus]